MSQPQPPARRPARRHSTDGPQNPVATAVRRAGTAESSDGGGQQLIRAAGVPLIAAALVAGGSGTASAQTAHPPSSAPAAPATPSKDTPRTAKTTPAKTTPAKTTPAKTTPATTTPAKTTPAKAGPAKTTPAKTTPAKTTPAKTTPATTTPVVSYTVKSGDSVATIAARTKLRPETIIAANRLPADGLIRPGQRLVLPGLTPARPKRTVTPKAQLVVHTVKPGDTVTDLATRYKIRPAAIVKANRLGPAAVIRPGQKLVMPGVPARPATPAPPTHGYVVKAGDTLAGISRTAKAELVEVLTLNQLAAEAVIHPGQRLLLPGPDPSAVPNTFLGRTYPDAVARAAAANRATLAGRQVPSRDQMQAIVVDAARSMSVDPALAQAIAYQESGFNQRAVSPANAIGTMQVIPRTGAWASDLVGRPLDLLDPRDNATAGVAVLAALLAQAPEPDAVAGYYQGLASVRAHGMYDDTRRYVASVLTLKARFGGGSGQPDPTAADPA